MRDAVSNVKRPKSHNLASDIAVFQDRNAHAALNHVLLLHMHTQTTRNLEPISVVMSKETD